jgi:hypothetical protein
MVMMTGGSSVTRSELGTQGGSDERWPKQPGTERTYVRYTTDERTCAPKAKVLKQ